ncbi:hypothetical protein ACFQRB_17255 [Halobaculum litoreum]|uniref:Uncharacterized protein n=1 Tax=Halobaculum litoreum TaxID=3031998 RepID=A0ABD5XRK6_9EURY
MNGHCGHDGVELPTLDPGVTLLDADSSLGVEPLCAVVLDRLLHESGRAFWVDAGGHVRTRTLLQLHRTAATSTGSRPRGGSPPTSTRRCSTGFRGSSPTRPSTATRPRSSSRRRWTGCTARTTSHASRHGSCSSGASRRSPGSLASGRCRSC